MNIRGIFVKTSSVSEKAAGDEQTEFGRHASDVTTFLTTTYAQENIRARRFSLLSKLFLAGEPKKVLEVGAGLGDFSVYCSANFPQHDYTVSDLTEGKFEKYFSEVIGFFGSKNQFKLASFEAESIPLPDDTYDLVFIRSAVHHFENPQQAFSELHRILKPKGRVVFFHDPIVLDIPIVREIQKFVYGSEGRVLGFNEHAYTEKEYLAFGCLFEKKELHLDPLLLEEFERHSNNWRGIKGSIGKFLPSHPFLFHQFLIYQYGIPFYFVFQK